jgi:hypothetical protein
VNIRRAVAVFGVLAAVAAPVPTTAAQPDDTDTTDSPSAPTDSAPPDTPAPAPDPAPDPEPEPVDEPDSAPAAEPAGPPADEPPSGGVSAPTPDDPVRADGTTKGQPGAGELSSAPVEVSTGSGTTKFRLSQYTRMRPSTQGWRRPSVVHSPQTVANRHHGF